MRLISIPIPFLNDLMRLPLGLQKSVLYNLLSRRLFPTNDVKVYCER